MAVIPVCVLDNFCAIKDPQEILDYTIDYTVILQGTIPNDAISTSTWSVTNGDGSLVILSDSHDGLLAKVWVSGGGKLGSLWKLVNHIVTVDGREYERTISIDILSK